MHEKRELKSVSPQDVGSLLHSLVEKSYYSEEREIFGIKWEFATLSQKEITEAQEKVSPSPESLSSLFSVAIEILSRSIRRINGVPITDVFEVDSNLSAEERRSQAVVKMRNYLEQLAPELVNELFTAYMDIADKRAKILEELKKK